MRDIFFDRVITPGLLWIDEHYTGWQAEAVSMLWILLTTVGAFFAVGLTFYLFFRVVIEVPFLAGAGIAALLVITLRPNKKDPPRRKEWK